MKRPAIVACGALIALAALWGGAYAVEVFPGPDWRNLPSFVTAMLVFAGGFALAAWGVAA